MTYQRDHRFVRDNLSAYLDGRLTDRERTRVERHLASCQDCQEDLASLRQTVSLLRRVPPRPVPRSFVLPAAAQKEQARYRRSALAYNWLRGAAVAVSFVLVLLLTSDALFGLGTFQAANPMPAPRLTGTAVSDRGPGEATRLLVPPAAEGQGGAAEGSVPAEPSQGAPGVAMAPKAAPESAASDAGEAGRDRSAAGTPVPMPKVSGALPAQQPTPAGAPAAAAPQGETQAAPTAAPTPTPHEQRVAAALPTAAPTAASLADEPMAQGESSSSTTGFVQPPALGRAWGTVRLLAGILGGLLLILLAGLLWFGQRRRW